MLPADLPPGSPPASTAGRAGTPPPPFMARRVLNAWGTATPFGVSRSPPAVAQAAAQALQRFVLVQELQAEAGRRLARWGGAEAGCVTHCSAAAVTLAVAACMAGTDPERIAQLPDAAGLRRGVVLPASMQVHYGQAITQAVRLAGAEPRPCASLDEVAAAARAADVACVLAVESHLAPGSGPEATRRLLQAARAAGVPLVLDAAAQDWRAPEVMAAGADLVLFSGQKYLQSPTAGLVLGRAALVAAVEAQHAGIGRAMKPSKEALAGVVAALEQREQADRRAWLAEQARKIQAVAQAAASWPGVRVERAPDPQGNGFERLWLHIDAAVTGLDAAALVARLRAGDPVVAVAPHRTAQGCIGLELTGVAQDEVAELCTLLARAVAGG